MLFDLDPNVMVERLQALQGYNSHAAEDTG